jgi:acylglycerol lipase
MKHEEGFFEDLRNRRIYYRHWLPEGEAKAVLLVVHGLAEHSGRYMNLVNYFLPLGYAVSAVDLPGHGRSEGAQGHVDRFTDYTDTVAAFHDMVRNRLKDKPVFLVGHSMGGLIGALYLLDHQEELAGAVLSGPLVKAHGSIPAAAILAGKFFSALAPKLKLIALEAAAVSRDPAVVKAYDNDPLVYRGKITARLGSEMLKAMRRIVDEASGITLPLLILQGSEDRLVDPSGTQMLYDRTTSPDKRIILYEGLYHEVYNEPEHDRVFKDVETWLAAHLAQAGF